MNAIARVGGPSVTMKGLARAVLQHFTRACHARRQSGRNDLRCGNATDDNNVLTKSGEGTIHRPSSLSAKSRCRWGKSEESRANSVYVAAIVLAAILTLFLKETGSAVRESH
jgi:hypothetical protein